MPPWAPRRNGVLVNPATATVGAVVVMTLAVCGVGAIAAVALVSSDSCTVDGEPVDLTDRWSPEQIGNATTIVEVGARMRVPSYGWVIAVATAIQESGLRNLGYLGERNDHDSLGLFQQRPSQGWGTPEQVMDPVHASTRFYEKLLAVDGWQQMPLTVAAQRVQVSAFPGAYAKHEADARRIVQSVASGVDCAGDWVVPLPAGSYILTSPYGPRWGFQHDGQDFSAATGTPILAAAGGTVIAAGCTSPFCDRPGDVDGAGTPVTPGCGWRAVLMHPGQVATVYCHATALSVHEGQTVTARQVIGWVGSTGNSTGAHLHFEVHVDAPPVDSSTAVDPVAYLASVGVKV